MKNIMIVEDDLGMQEIYRDIFSEKKDEYKVELFGDGRLAYKRAKEGDIDMIILDMIMEPMDGNEFYACLRNQSDKKINSIPVLVVSVINPNSLIEMKRINNVDFLQKPVTGEQLFRKIDERTERLCG